jgi:hypothetical protein
MIARLYDKNMLSGSIVCQKAEKSLSLSPEGDLRNF